MKEKQNEITAAINEIRKSGERLLDEFLLLSEKDQSSVLPHLIQIKDSQAEFHKAMEEIKNRR